MLLTTETIERIKDVLISDVIGHFIKLTKKSSDYLGLCPFHNEKSPSFTVSNKRGVNGRFKCFGCGKSGDAIEFVMQHENKTFFEACEVIAQLGNIPLEYEAREVTEKEKERLSAAQLQEQVLNHVVPIYRGELWRLDSNHPAKQWLYSTGLTDEMIDEWELGWSPNDFGFITPTLISKGWLEPALKMGIIKRKNENSYDGYRSRIIFPIHDINGRLVGLGGRYIRIEASDARDIPKYINPADCEIYNKSAVLFGLKQAARAIREEKTAYITEGYMDVIGPYTKGFKNVVATCGTAFTESQMRLIKRHTDQLIMWRDNDNAGINSTVASLPTLLKNDFGIRVFDYKEFQGKDPGDFSKALDTYNNGNGIHLYRDDDGLSLHPSGSVFSWSLPELIDGVIWQANRIWKESSDDIRSMIKARTEIMHLIANITNSILRDNYLDFIIKLFNWKSADVKRDFKKITETIAYPEDEDDMGTDDSDMLPDWLDDSQKEEFFSKGYVSVNKKERGKPMIGYYSFNNGAKIEITNFLVNPLFHIYAGSESRYLLQIYNGYKHGILDLPARKITSIDQFQAETVGFGSFIIYGVKIQWLRIVTELLHVFPLCWEIHKPGWHDKGFFCFLDRAYIPGEGMVEMNEWGIFSHNNTNYLMPASCKAYTELMESSKDNYENLRYLQYKNSPVDFTVWSKQMNKVYKQKGIVAIAYVIITLFRDIVFAVDNNFPHLYGFGEPSSGKSKWAESITAIFYHKRSAFNLNSGTEFAFNNYGALYVNCPAHMNELDIEVIKMEWFQTLKGAYDGEGRERGKISGGKSSTEVTRIRGSLILTGQKLVTYDDNSLVTRCLIEPFAAIKELTEEEKQNYDKLKAWEARGMSSMLVEILQFRQLFVEQYRDNLNMQLSQWRKTKAGTRNLNQRILQNWAHLVTGYKMLSEHFQFPQDVAEFSDYCYSRAEYWSHFIRSSDTLSEFWRTLEFLFNQQQVEEGWDYIISEETSITIRTNKYETEVISFERPTKVLFLRINNVHKLFQTAYRQRTGKEAMSLENLLHYFSSRDYFKGTIKAKRFARYITKTEESATQGFGGNNVHTIKKIQAANTTCYAFLYDDLGICIDTGAGVPEEKPEPPKNGGTGDTLPF